MPSGTPITPPKMYGADPAGHASFQDFGMSSRSCPKDINWFAVESAIRRGTPSLGGSNRRQEDPTAENPKPESPLISPEMHRMTAMTISCHKWKPTIVFPERSCDAHTRQAATTIMNNAATSKLRFPVTGE